MLKKVLAAIAALALAISVQSGSALADAWVPALGGGQDTIGLNLVDNFANTGEQMSRLVYVEQLPNNHFAEHICTGVGAGQWCQGNIPGIILLPACKTAEQFNCIDSLAVGTTADSTLKPATFVRQAGGPILPADSAHGLTEGSTISLWQADAKHAGGTGNYAVYASLNAIYTADSGKFSYNYLTAMVMPFNPVTSSNPYEYQNPSLTPFTGADGNPHVGYGGGRVDCAYTENGSCGRLQDFAADAKVSLTLRLPVSIGGWFKGRVVDPNIKVTPGAGSGSGVWQSISMEGQPANVPMFNASTPKSQATQAMLDVAGPNFQGGTMNMRNDTGDGSFRALDAFKSITSDSAAGLSTIWSMGSIAGGSNQCLQDTTKVLGVVSTNAMVYAPDAPKFENGQLQYKVGGTHYLADKSSLSEGSYDLIIDSAAARCLYGFTSAPISAAINVVSSDGQTKVATTTFKEANGWVKLSARGFTFSDPTVSVRFSQAKAPVVKKTTITCVSLKNKKLTKTVTAVAPKCPAGYKKK